MQEKVDTVAEAILREIRDKRRDDGNHGISLTIVIHCCDFFAPLQRAFRFQLASAFWHSGILAAPSAAAACI